jgi:hypothetical protein
LVSLAGVGAVVAIGLGLAGNAATSGDRWPGLLAGLRKHPWPWVGALAALSVVAVCVAVWIQERVPAADDPPPPPPAVVPGWFVDREQTRATVGAVCSGGRAVGRLKNYKILRDCRQHGDGLHHAVQAVAHKHNLALAA